MAHYLIRGTYSSEAVQAVVEAGAASRREAVQSLFESVGGTVVAGPFWSGDNLAAVGIVDLPSSASVAAVLSTALAQGAVPSVTAELLLTAEELDEGRSLSPAYRPPTA